MSTVIICCSIVEGTHLMEFLLRNLNIIAWIGTITSSIYLLLVLFAGFHFRLKRKLRPRNAVPPPPVSLLKPLHGIEAGLRTNLASHFAQDYSGDFEILFCARSAEDEGLLLARSIAELYPDVKCQFLVSGEPQFPNAKVHSLSVMAMAASHELFVTTDADVRVERDYLARCVAEIESGAVELAFCLYRGIPVIPTLALRLDALGKTVEMGSGVMVAVMFTGVDFALGPSMMFHRRAIADAGGFREIGDYYADDFVFGHRLAARGRRVEIAAHVVELVVAAKDGWTSFTNQLRWMQSTRRSRPWGHLGTGLIFAVPFGLLGFFTESSLGHATVGIALLLAAILNRVTQSAVVLTLLGERDVASSSCLYPLRDLLGGVLWLCSYLPLRTQYHDTSFKILPDGRLTPVPHLERNA